MIGLGGPKLISIKRRVIHASPAVLDEFKPVARSRTGTAGHTVCTSTRTPGPMVEETVTFFT
ncbi:hypothetical protein SIID45300_02363 [Candidatus Magnetaquicoccaceae bacterium FCR-1]|uniref:Uncharacterized protein n=1 Tax=Candidatus Magnetaquiglobus chichijimensis TaxID=3141448 RepID=A0ABQ0CAX8_9PROT